MSKVRFSTHYERNPYYRAKAIEIYGTVCQACQFDFAAKYGELGRGYIHVHHVRPISETGPTRIDPATDLTVLCPNCHSMVHRKKKVTLSLDELKRVLEETGL